MAASFLSTADNFLSSSSSHKHTTTTPSIICKSFKAPKSLITDPISLPKRGFCLGFATSIVPFVNNGGEHGANAAILEADDDEELLEKVRKDRQKRIERQGVIKSSTKETAYLQDVIYNLSKVGQAIENNDLAVASSVLGKSTETEWIQKANTAFTTISSGPEEKAEVDTFNSSIAKLISSVVGNDAELSKVAFVSSATAFEKWTTLTGLVDQLKGL